MVTKPKFKPAIHNQTVSTGMVSTKGYKSYMPILKAKEGEYRAFRSLDRSLASVITPLFEVVPSEEAIEDKLRAAAIKLEKNLAKWPLLFVDLSLLGATTTAADYALLFSELRTRGVNAAPVVRIQDGDQTLAAVADVIAKDSRGMCLRLTQDDLSSSSIASAIDRVLGQTGCDASRTHLLLDFESIHNVSTGVVRLSATAVMHGLHRLLEWASITFAGSAFPQSLAGIAANSIEAIDRKEWYVWKDLLKAGLPRNPGFGDYGISHPQLLNIDPRKMQMSASIRYTSNGNWLCVKGRGVKKHGFPQFHTLSQQLVARSEYAGRAYSDGDRYIDDCAKKVESPGNATTWRWVGNVHHLTTVGRGVTSLS